MDGQYTFEDYLNVVRKLRSPGGCPWDRAQTHESLRPYMIEEAYEVLDGIRLLGETGRAENLCEELGDVLLQVLLHSVIAQEEGYFQIDDVIDGGCRKMIRRHPHVFPEKSEWGAGEKPDWEEIKRREKGVSSPEEELLMVPREFPALLRAVKTQKKIRKITGGAHTFSESAENIRRALAELAGDETGGADAERIADILYEVCSIAALRGVHAEQALADRVQKETEAALKKRENP